MAKRIKGRIPTINANKATVTKTGHRHCPRLTSLLRKPLPPIVSNLLDFFLMNRLESQIEIKDMTIKITAKTKAKESSPRARLA